MLRIFPVNSSFHPHNRIGKTSSIDKTVFVNLKAIDWFFKLIVLFEGRHDALTVN